MLKSTFSKLNSIKFKFLFSTILFVIIFTVIIIYFWYSTAKKDAEVSAITYTSEMFDISNENLIVALKDINSIISVLSVNSSDEYSVFDVLRKNGKISESDQYQDDKRISDLLTKLSNNKYYLNGIMVSDLKGRYFKSGITMPYEDLITQPWYNTIINSHGEKVFIPPHIYDKYNTGGKQPGYRDMVFSYAKAIIDEGKIIGFVIADIKCEILTSIFNPIIKGTSYLYIADTNLKEVIYNAPSNNSPLLDDEAGVADILNKANKPKGSFYLDLSHKNYLAVYSRSSFTGWVTIGLIPVHTLLESFYKSRDYVIILTVIFCAFAFILLYIISTILTKNILRLNRAVSGISGDNLELLVNINAKDEVGQLYHQINSMVNRIKELIVNIKFTEKEKINAEIKFLQSQINPHFLYNTLNTIKFIASLHGIENIKKVSESLSTLLHINMDPRVFISVGEETEYIKSYLGIQEFRYNNIVYNILVEDNVKELMTLKLLLQPVVENSLLHGISGRDGQGIINIKIYLDDNRLKMRIQDNGVGISEKTIAAIMENKIEAKGIGLNNIISRISMYFGPEYGISIHSQPGLFSVIEISLPVITKDEVKNFA